MLARQIYATVDGVLQTGPAPRFSNSTDRTIAKVPRRGQGGATLLAELGFSEDDISLLVTAGAVILPTD
jgi:alpha-methylacyl-CoA racemase